MNVCLYGIKTIILDHKIVFVLDKRKKLLFIYMFLSFIDL